MQCEKDCWKCELEGCPYTLMESHILDLEAGEVVTETPRQRAIRRYNKSEKGRAANKRWRTSEKGKEYRRQDKKKFYEKNRERILEQKRLYYLAHAEEIKKRRKERYAEKKLEKSIKIG